MGPGVFEIQTDVLLSGGTLRSDARSPMSIAERGQNMVDNSLAMRHSPSRRW